MVTAAGDTWTAEPVWAQDGTASLRDGTFEVSVTITSVAASLWFRAQNGSNNYLWQLRAGTPGVLKTHVQRDGAYAVLSERTIGAPVPTGTPVRVRIELAGSTIKTYPGEALIDTTVDATYATGTVGLRNGSTESQRYHFASFTDPTGRRLVDEDFSSGPGVFAGGTVFGGDLVLDRGRSLLAVLGESNDWALLRSEFVLPDNPVAAAFVYATGQSPAQARQYVYKMWLNDALVGVGPVRAMAGEARYETHEVTAGLKPGINALSALCYSTAGRSFQAQLVVLFSDGTRQVIATGDDWRTRRAGRWRPAAGFTGGGFYQAPQEYVDARAEPVGWTAPGYDDRDWEPAAVATLTRALEPAWVDGMGYTYVRPAAVERLEPGRWLLDMGGPWSAACGSPSPVSPASRGPPRRGAHRHRRALQPARRSDLPRGVDAARRSSEAGALGLPCSGCRGGTTTQSSRAPTRSSTGSGRCAATPSRPRVSTSTRTPRPANAVRTRVTRSSTSSRSTARSGRSRSRDTPRRTSPVVPPGLRSTASRR